MKCISCGDKNAEYEHHDGGYVCQNCIGQYFTCPDCGILFNSDDYENGDQGNGFCSECSPNH